MIYKIENNEIIEYDNLGKLAMKYTPGRFDILIDRMGYTVLGYWKNMYEKRSQLLISKKYLQQLINISKNWFDSKSKAQAQVIRNLKRELEEVIGISEARLQCNSRYKHIQENERKIKELERELRKEQCYTESLLQDIELRKECISRFHERAEKYEDKCELLEKIVAGQKKIIDEKMAKIESLEKNYYEENCNLRNCLDEYQKIIFDQHDKIAELEATLERIRMEVVSQTNKSTKRGAK